MGDSERERKRGYRPFMKGAIPHTSSSTMLQTILKSQKIRHELKA